jgi:type II secretory pathway pseudopilin PulG
MTGPEPHKSRHLSLLEVAIVLTVIAAASLFAIPQVQSRRILVHEERARALLREIHAAEKEFLLANDGATYGFLKELLGNEHRSGVHVTPKLLAASGLRASDYAHDRDGYHFMVVLPGRGVPGVTHDTYANADFEKLGSGFLAYAWPIMSGYSGRLVYVIDETGELRQHKNDLEPPFSGLAAPPPLNFGARKGGPFGEPPPIVRTAKIEPAVE